MPVELVNSSLMLIMAVLALLAAWAGREASTACSLLLGALGVFMLGFACAVPFLA